MHDSIKVLDHGFVRLVESWGHGDAGNGDAGEGYLDIRDYECGIIEAARQSTQASFRGWEDVKCADCRGTGSYVEESPVHGDRCVKCEGKGFFPGDARLLRTLFCNKPPHATPFEFAGCVIEVRAPIFVFREWHRHRVQSYNEMSARYAPLPDLNYMPTADRCFNVSTKNKQAGVVKGSDGLTCEAALEWLEEQADLYERFERHYQKGLKIGMPKEIARIGMPVGRYSQMRASTNLRNWLAFMTLRNDPGAQWEIQQYAQAVATILADQFPRTWALYVEGKKV